MMPLYHEALFATLDMIRKGALGEIKNLNRPSLVERIHNETRIQHPEP